MSKDETDSIKLTDSQQRRILFYKNSKHLLHKLMSDYYYRKMTLDDVWMKPFISIADLALAGFFSTGFSDQVECFDCGIVLHDWNSVDKPWEEHAFWSPTCAHVMSNKGRDFIESVNRKFKQHSGYAQCELDYS